MGTERGALFRNFVVSEPEIGRATATGSVMSASSAPTRTATDAEWADLFRRHRSWLWTIVRSRNPDPHEAADILQEIALALVRRTDSPAAIERIEPWLYRLVLRQVQQYRRSRGRSRRREDRWAREHEGEAEPAASEWVLREEARAQVRGALAELRDGDRDIVVLKLVERWSYDRIASHLGLSRHAVEYRLQRAREALRSRLGETSDMTRAS
ncbi:MAG TPA: hypothetical protein DCQ98_16575 [Planctomycetaceae bacterium]|nr:hypothetical protein [Planctomycetaceae bacterium]